MVVSAASGAVGAVVGQIARLKGCRVVGIAGAREKCDYVVDELGFDACVSHRDPDLAGALGAACPDGIDVYFENVGGAVFQAVLATAQPLRAGTGVRAHRAVQRENPAIRRRGRPRSPI